MNTNTSNRGFIKTVTMTVIALVAVNIFFGFDLVQYLDKELILSVWNEDIVRPTLFIWHWITGLFK